MPVDFILPTKILISLKKSKPFSQRLAFLIIFINLNK